MKRLYFVSDDLDDLESIETELEHSGVETAQIHVLSNNDTGVQNHHLHGVDSFSKLDVVHSALFGIGVGVVCVMFALSFYAMSEAYLTYTWMPAIMLSVVLLGFCTWEGGLWGIQKPNRRFAKFKKVLDEGKHVLFIDVKPQNKDVIEAVVRAHPKLSPVGSGVASPGWLVSAQTNFGRFAHWGP